MRFADKVAVVTGATTEKRMGEGGSRWCSDDARFSTGQIWAVDGGAAYH